MEVRIAMSCKETLAPEGGLRLLILNTLEPNPNAHLTHAVAEGFADVLGPDRVHVARYADACARVSQGPLQRRAAVRRPSDAHRGHSGTAAA